MSKTKKTALGGLITALSCILMISSNIIPLGLYIFPALSGILIYIYSSMAGDTYAWSVYAAVTFVSFIFCTDKEVVLCFVFFLGYYPVIRKYIEKIKSKVLVFIIKEAVFNAAVGAVYLMITFVFSISSEQLEIFGINVPLLFWILLNITFVLYDTSLKLFSIRYETQIIKIITKIFK